MRLEATSFKGREQELRDDLFGPLFEKDITPELAYSETLQKKHGDKIKELREYTDPWVLLLMRSLFSVIRVYQDRKITVPLKALIQEVLPKEIASTEASLVRIEVTEKGKQVIALKFPITSLPNLAQMMPGKVLEKLREANLNLGELIKNAGTSPQDLFSLQSGDRHYRVWME